MSAIEEKLFETLESQAFSLAQNERLPQEKLNELFELDLSNHELVDPPEGAKGEVVKIRELLGEEREGCPKEVGLFDIVVTDPYVEADPTMHRIVTDYIEHIEKTMKEDGYDPIELRMRLNAMKLAGDERLPYELAENGNFEAMSPDQYNKYTKAWVSGKNVDGVRLWRSLVPTAEALGFLTNPQPGLTISNVRRLNEAGEIGVVSKETAAQLRFTADGIGVRDRATAMQFLATEHLLSGAEGDQRINWLSLASGTAEPALAASMEVTAAAKEYNLDIDIELTVADIDQHSLSHVRQNAERLKFPGKINTVFANILGDDLPERLQKKTGNLKYKVVENLGFQEYLPQEGDELGAFLLDGKLPQASEFTRKAYERVEPGGILISGNMVLDRPQIGFVFGIVDWPIINARSETSILRVYEKAGILDEVKAGRAKIEMFRVKNAADVSNLNIYNIVRVTKLGTQ